MGTLEIATGASHNNRGAGTVAVHSTNTALIRFMNVEGWCQLKSRSESILLETKSRLQLVDITRAVEQTVRASAVVSGICLVHVAHATAGIIANENESGLIDDFLRKIDQFFPPRGEYLHNRIDDNAASHLAAGFIGNSRVFPVENGNLLRGTWQNIFLVELDGPRSRRSVEVTVLGE